MKQILTNTLLLFLLGLLLGCNKYEVMPREYPRIKTLPVTENTTEGVKFDAEIILRGDMEILSHGFVWGGPNPTKERNHTRISFDALQDNNFSQIIVCELRKGVNYHMRAFVETNDFIVYGENVEFVSLGTYTTDCGGFSPKVGILKDTIDIKGVGFNFRNGSNKVRFGNTVAEVISSSDSLLRVIVPFDLEEEKSPITVEVGSEVYSFDEEFTLLKPKVVDIEETEITYCDSVKFIVENFPSNSLIKVHFLDQVTTAVRIGQDEIITNVPFFIRDKGNINPIVEIGNFNLSSNKELIFKNPQLDLTSDPFIGFHDTLTIVHLNLEKCDLEVLIEAKKVPIIGADKNETKVRIPSNIINPRAIPIQVKVGEETLISEWIERRVVTNTIVPSSAKPGDLVRIEGRGYQPFMNKNEIYFAPNAECLSKPECRIRCTVIESSGRHIIFRVPDDVRGFTDSEGNTFLGIISQFVTSSPLKQYKIIL